MPNANSLPSILHCHDPAIHQAMFHAHWHPWCFPCEIPTLPHMFPTADSLTNAFAAPLQRCRPCSRFHTRKIIDLVLGSTLLSSWTMIVCADGHSTDGSLSWRTHWVLGLTLERRIHTATWRCDCPGRLILDVVLSKVKSHQQCDGQSCVHYTCKSLMMRLQQTITHPGHFDVTRTLA